MGIPSNHPQIVVLRKHVESQFGKALSVHADFVALSAEIENLQRQHISESTIERVWNYSTRGYQTISLRTLDVLAVYAGSRSWKEFGEKIHRDGGIQSEIFDNRTIKTEDLHVGDRLRIGWPPDRICEIRYQGSNRFIAGICQNATMKEGDTFQCLQFSLGQPLILHEFRQAANGMTHPGYMVGQHDGLTLLEIISKEKPPLSE